MTTLEAETKVEVPPNPFVVLRLNSGLSHVDLGKQMFVSKQALIRLEQGMFERPLPNVLDYWVDKGESELALTDAYEEFQERTRQYNHKVYGSSLFVNEHISQHPFSQLRRTPGINKTEAARRMCVAQSTLQRWETNWRNQKTVPRSIQSAFLEMGYTSNQVQQFNMQYSAWRKYMSAKLAVGLVR